MMYTYDFWNQIFEIVEIFCGSKATQFTESIVARNTYV